MKCYWREGTWTRKGRYHIFPDNGTWSSRWLCNLGY
jgi:hypothetical protein